MHNSIFIYGLGMMGASLASAIRANKLAKNIYAYDIERKALIYAKRKKIIDDYEDKKYSYLSSADLIIICTPLSSYKSIFSQISKYNKRAYITDIGSTKVSITNLIPKNLQDNFVGSHPLTGKESSSILNADKNLFKSAVVLMTPTKITNKRVKLDVAKFWSNLTCKVHFIDSLVHDKVMSITSHLPHLISFALVNNILSSNLIKNIKDYTGGGFEDFARLSRSNPLMWKDICKTNKKNILSSIVSLQKELNKIKSLVRKSDNTLSKYFSKINNKLDK